MMSVPERRGLIPIKWYIKEVNMKKAILKALILFTVLVLTAGIACPGLAELAKSIHPIVDPQPVTYVETEDEYFNLLLLGIDLLSEEYGGSGGKKTINECHTDAIMLVSMNLTKNSINILSIPRDTFAYVPGVHGMYKINAAINCADTVEDGCLRSCETVSWLLGGVKVDRYCALDVPAMIALGDAMGGIDFYVDMTYSQNDRHYDQGMQHLNGQGILDYVRVRKSATVDPNDQGRTRRQRAMMIAIYQKIKDNLPLINDLYAMAMGGELNFFTNLEPVEYLKLLPIFLNMDFDAANNFMMTGHYGDSGISSYYFNKIIQEDRIALIKTMFGLEVEELPFVGKKDIIWLGTDGRGMKVARRILLARQLYETASKMDLNEEQKQLLDELEERHNATIAAFDEDAVKQSDKTYTALGEAFRKMQYTGDKLKEALNLGNIPWNNNGNWYRDKVVFDYPNINWN